jgi:hypothetical protein
MMKETVDDPIKDRVMGQQHRPSLHTMLQRALMTLAISGMLSVAAMAPSATVARAFGPPPPPPVGFGGPPPLAGAGGPPPFAGIGRPPLPHAGALPGPSRLAAPPAARGIHHGVPGNVRGLQGNAARQAYGNSARFGYGRAARSGYDHSARSGYGRYGRYGYWRYGYGGSGSGSGSYAYSSDGCYYTYNTGGRSVLVCDDE